MNIKTIQEDFISAIFGGDNSPAASHVIGGDVLSAEQRFGIYTGSVHGILTQALGATFPVCKALVGDQFFDNMCKIFIDTHPPTTSFFAEYGDKFPEFLTTFKPVKDIAYFVDVARFEWARHDVWHQQSSEQSDFSSLATLNEDQQDKVIFQLSKTLRLIQSDYRIDELWFAHQDDESISLETIEIEKPVKLFIFKNEGVIKVSSMNETESDSAFWDFIEAISKGRTLGLLADEFGEALSEHLSQGIQSGWIQSFK